MDKKQWVVLWVLAAIQFTHVMDIMIMMPLGPQLMRIFNISPTQFGAAVSAYTISAGVFGFLASFYIDRFDRKVMLIAIYSGFILGTLACALSIDFHILYISRILAGSFGGVLGALILSVIADVFPIEKRALAMGSVMAAFSVASVFGVPSGLYLAAQFHWHSPFFAIVGISLPVLVFIALFLPKLNQHLESGRQTWAGSILNLKDFFGKRKSILAMLLMLSLMFAQFIIIPYVAAYMVFNVGFKETELALIYLAGGACTIFTSPIIGKLADKFGHARLFLIVASLSFLPVYLLTDLGTVSIGIALLVTTLFFVIGGGRMSPALTLMTITVSPSKRGQFMSIITSLQQLGSGLAAYVGGLVIYEGANKQIINYPYLGYIAMSFNLVCMLIVYCLKQMPNDE